MNQETMSENLSVTHPSEKSSEEKRFIDDTIFNELLTLREAIYQETEINVSVRKLVNLLLAKADFDACRIQLIKQYS